VFETSLDGKSRTLTDQIDNNNELKGQWPDATFVAALYRCPFIRLVNIGKDQSEKSRLRETRSGKALKNPEDPKVRLF
jgi:hypothetical protein